MLRDHINMLCKSQRVVNQIQVMPNDRWELQADVMTMASRGPGVARGQLEGVSGVGSGRRRGIGGMGYFLNDEIGDKFIEHGLELGIPNFAIHKGLPIPGFDVEHNQPLEIGEVAKKYPRSELHHLSLRHRRRDEQPARPVDRSRTIRSTRASAIRRCTWAPIS